MSVAMASVILSASMTVPVVTPIMAESTIQSNEISINTPQDFIDAYLSKKTLDENGNVLTYEAYKTVDEITTENYQTILSSEVSYNSLSEELKTQLDQTLVANGMPTYASFLAHAKEIEASLQPQEETVVQQEQEQIEAPQVQEETVVEQEQPQTVVEETPQVQEETVITEQPVQTETTDKPYTYTAVVSGITVTVQASEGAFPENVEMVATPVEVDGALLGIDIYFHVAGSTEEIEPTSAVTVTLNYSDLGQSEDLTVVHILDDASRQTLGNATSTSATFDTTTFSTFAIVAQAQVTTEEKVEATTTEEKVETSTETDTNTSSEKVETDTTSSMTSEEKSENDATASAFVTTYVSDTEGNVYTEATASNYAQIISGTTAWNNMSVSQRARVNAILTQNSNKTYLALLKEAQTYNQGKVVNTAVYNQTSTYTWLATAAAGAFLAILSKIKKLNESES